MEVIKKQLLNRCRLIRDYIYCPPLYNIDIRHTKVINYLKNVNTNEIIYNWIDSVDQLHCILGQSHNKGSYRYQKTWDSDELYLSRKPDGSDCDASDIKLIIEFIDRYISEIENICQDENKKYDSAEKKKKLTWVGLAENKSNLFGYCACAGFIGLVLIYGITNY
jgi:hypothetical protein